MPEPPKKVDASAESKKVKAEKKEDEKPAPPKPLTPNELFDALIAGKKSVKNPYYYTFISLL
jgi:hypothetical protein